MPELASVSVQKRIYVMPSLGTTNSNFMSILQFVWTEKDVTENSMKLIKIHPKQ
jgi:hypothetical protein